MPAMIVPQFQKFSAEGILIGRLLAGYGSLESALSAAVGMLRRDLDMTIKAMFRPRGETQRIDIADALGRQPYHAVGLGNQFSEAISGMRYCLKIRNQFAHCHWHDDLKGRLCFVDMQEIAIPHTVITDLLGLTFRYVDVPLLETQEAYFVYIADWLVYLNYEGRKRAGEFPSHARTNPKKVARPPLSIP